jgi:hypothetical protein
MGYSRSQAIEVLFNKKLSAYDFFKLRLTGFEDNKTLAIERYAKQSGEGGRGKRVYLKEHLNLLFNVTIISAFFGKPAIVHEIVKNPKDRKRHMDDIRRLLGERLKIGLIQFDSEKLVDFFSFMDSERSLIKEKVPNTFLARPQFMVAGKERYISVYEAYKAGSTEKTDIEQMLLAYFDKDIEQAYLLAGQLSDLDGYDAQVQDRIFKEYEDAICFDNLLDDFVI